MIDTSDSSDSSADMVYADCDVESSDSSDMARKVERDTATQLKLDHKGLRLGRSRGQDSILSMIGHAIVLDARTVAPTLFKAKLRT